MFSVKRVSTKPLIDRLCDSLNNTDGGGIKVAPNVEQIMNVIAGFAAASFIICIIVIAVCSLQLMKYRRNG